MITINAYTRSQRGKTNEFYHRDALGLMVEMDFDRSINKGERVHVTYLIKDKLNNRTIVKKVFEYTANNRFNNIWMSQGDFWNSRSYSTPGGRYWGLAKTDSNYGLYGFTAVVRLFKPNKRYNEWVRLSENPIISNEFLFEYINMDTIVFDG